MIHSSEWLRTKEDRVLSPEWTVCGFFPLFVFICLTFLLKYQQFRSHTGYQRMMFQKQMLFSWMVLPLLKAQAWDDLLFCREHNPYTLPSFKTFYIHYKNSDLGSGLAIRFMNVMQRAKSLICCIWDWAGGPHTGINISTSLICVSE